MKKVIHINQHVIRSNTKSGKQDPPITVKTYKSNTRARSVVIHDAQGREVARIVYRPEKPLSCGAKVWIETKNELTIIE